MITYLLGVLCRASLGAVMPERAIIFSGGGPPCGCFRMTIVSPDNTYVKQIIITNLVQQFTFRWNVPIPKKYDATTSMQNKQSGIVGTNDQLIFLLDL